MELYHISNDILSVSVSNLGAELQSIQHKETSLEYMWSGNPDYWGKKSPVLFPIVGGLKNNTYHYKESAYKLNRHGFARERVFKLTHQSAYTLQFNLQDDPTTLLVYPFPFSFTITYRLEGNKIHVIYEVINTGDEAMYFSVGAHPAFAVPLVSGTNFEDYYLQFNQKENTGIWPLTKDGLIHEAANPFFNDNNQIALHKPLFHGDALVFKSLKSTAIAILSEKHSHGLSLEYHGFPYMGIWSSKDADFVCIEPWCGIADHVNASGNIETKEGINKLNPTEHFQRSWSVSLF